jgi:hypothetical protein
MMTNTYTEISFLLHFQFLWFDDVVHFFLLTFFSFYCLLLDVVVILIVVRSIIVRANLPEWPFLVLDMIWQLFQTE